MSFDQEWLDQAIEATAARVETGLAGTAAILIGKTVQISFGIADGRIVALGDGEPACELPFTKVQMESYLAGEMKLAVAYMRGDFKPTGSTGSILAAIDALDALAQS